MATETLIIRADASITMGTGHVMRCLALAQAWQDSGGMAVFAMAESTESIDRRLRAEGVGTVRLRASANSFEDAQQTAQLARDYGAMWVIVDGYQFDSAYQFNLKSTALKLLLVDDTGRCEKYFADIVLNQNVDASEAMDRNLTGDARLLLGSRYALMRREFWGWCDRRREIASVGSKVLIAMGGSDAENITLRIIDALQSLSGLEVMVVVGGSNPHWESLRQAALRFSGELELRRDVPDMPQLMTWADVAISAAGGTCYELALLQVPMLVIAVAENQQPTRRALAQHGAAIDLGSSEILDADCLAKSLQEVIRDFELRQSLAENARRRVDGRGAQRVVEALALEGRAKREWEVSPAQVSAK